MKFQIYFCLQGKVMYEDILYMNIYFFAKKIHIWGRSFLLVLLFDGVQLNLVIFLT